MNETGKTVKKLSFSIAAIIVLSVCLCVTTFALIYSTVTVGENLFGTGEVKIDLNGGNPVIRDSEYLSRPGMTVNKTFYIENKGSEDVYYRIYLDNLQGGLADVLEISITDGTSFVFAGKASELTKDNAPVADDILKPGERREFTISFTHPESAGNDTQNQFLSFDLKADAVQVRNNPDRVFG